jgi:integrase
LAPETVTLLRDHRRHQAELKMANRTAYRDHGLVFAKEWGHLHGRQDSLGLPLQSNNLGQREFARLLKLAKVRPITIHGLRPTIATLLLKAGSPRTWYSNGSATNASRYVRNLRPRSRSMQQDAARRLGTLLHG